MNLLFAAVAAVSLAWGPGAVAGSPAADTTAAVEPETAAVHFFFVTDVHSDYDVVDRLVEDANRELPDLVLEGGDFVHDGTWPEFQRAYEARERLEPPWYLAKGNHDAQRTGPFPSSPPPIPDFQAFSEGGVRFILLDNHGQGLSEAQFQRLEAELEANGAEPVVVAMHVPPFLTRDPAIARLRHVLPLHLPSPVMSDPADVERFVGLMAEHDVLAVLSGHAHFHDDHTVDGVRYVAAGTAGGMTPGMGIAREYLDVVVEGGEVRVRRVELKSPARDPFTFAARTFRFIAGVNSLSRAELGWTYVPTTSVRWRVGLRRTGIAGGEHLAGVATATMEDLLGAAGRRSAFADVALSGSRREALAHLALGMSARPVGDFNRALRVSGAGVLNGGLLGGRGTAGVGFRGEVGLEWRALTVTLGRTWATNHQTTGLVLGRRF